MSKIFRIILFNAIFFLIIFIYGCYSSSAVKDEENWELKTKKLFNNGKLSEAQSLLKTKLIESKLSKDIFLEAVVSKYLGTLYSPQYFGHIDSSFYYYEFAERILDSLNISNPQNISYQLELLNVQNNLALLYHFNKEYDKAIYIFEKILYTGTEIQDSNQIHSTLINLGRAYTDYGISLKRSSPLDADEFLKLASEKFSEANNIIYSPDVTMNIGRVFQVQENYKAAIEKFLIASNEYEQVGNFLWSGIALSNAAINYVDSLEILKHLSVENFLEVKSDEINSLKNKVIELFNKGIKRIEEARANISSDANRATFFDNKIIYHEEYLKFLIENDYLKESFEIVERAKSRSFLDMIGSKVDINAEHLSEEMKAKVEAEKYLSNRLTSLEKYPDSLSVYVELTEEYNSLVEKIKLEIPEYFALRNVDIVPLKQIQDELDDDDVIIEFYLGTSVSLSFYVDKDTLILHLINTGSYSLTDTIENLRESFIEYNDKLIHFKAAVKDEEMKKGNSDWVPVWKEKWKVYQTDGSFQYTLFTLYGILFGREVQNKISEKNHLIIIPHGILHHLPFGTLITSPRNLDREKGKHLVRPKYLIEEKTLSVLPSASILPFVKKKITGRFDNALIIGDPIYNSKEWAELKAAYEEAGMLSKKLPQNLLLRKGDATETKIKSIVSDYDILHFATHGYFNPDAVESKILLTQTDIDDGNLTVKEIFNLNLKANLVVLSACQTGQVGGYIKNKESAGDDLVGLTRAFIYAGTPSVLATLWVVDDRATSVIMQTFYDELLKNKNGKAAALRNAQIELLNDTSSIDWSHPFYWAPFFLFGMK